MIPIAVKGISDPTKIRVQLLASGQDVHAPLNAVAGAAIHGATPKATPVDADEFGYYDSVSAGPVKATWANIKATLKTYFDTLYQPLAAALTSWAAITRASGFDTFVATPSSANLAALLTDETGTGAAVFADSPTLTTGVTITSTDPGAGLGPTVDIYRNSASPAASDILGYVSYTGQNSAAAKKTFYDHYVVLLNPTAGSEASRVDFRTIVAGAVTTIYQIAAGITVGNATGGDKGSGSVNVAGNYYLNGSPLAPAPVTKTANFTVATTENQIIVSQAATTTATLPTASSFPGRTIRLKTIQAQTVVSASSNVVPLAGGAAGTAILSATAGKWADLTSDGSNWIIMASN